MRLSFVLYAALYVVVEIVVHELSQVSWPQLTPLMVATAATDALLMVAVAVAVLVTLDLTRPRWQPVVSNWVETRLPRPSFAWAHEALHEGPIDVRSWRSEPAPLPAGVPVAPRAAPGGTYGPSGHGRPFPEDDGRLL
jgi:hypothetical protein